MDRESNDGDKREFSRVETRPRVRLSLPNGEELLLAEVIDVSLGGLMLKGECDAGVGAYIVVTIILGGEGGEHVIWASGKIVRNDERGIAVEFAELESPDSLEHLRNLVLYNSTAPQAIEEEFQQHSGISRKAKPLS